MDNYEKLNEALAIVKNVRDALEKVDQILEQMRLLAGRAAAAETTPADRAALQKEIEAYTAAIDRIARAAAEEGAALGQEDHPAGQDFLKRINSGPASKLH